MISFALCSKALAIEIPGMVKSNLVQEFIEDYRKNEVKYDSSK